MPKRFRLTRRFPAAMTEDGYRQLRTFAREAGLDENEALSFLFENLKRVTDPVALSDRLHKFNAERDARQGKDGS